MGFGKLQMIEQVQEVACRTLLALVFLLLRHTGGVEAAGAGGDAALLLAKDRHLAPPATPIAAELVYEDDRKVCAGLARVLGALLLIIELDAVVADEVRDF